MGVVSECCCKEVYIYYRYPHNNCYFPLSTCINYFWGQYHPYSLFIFKCFFVLVNIKSVEEYYYTVYTLVIRNILHFIHVANQL